MRRWFLEVIEGGFEKITVRKNKKYRGEQMKKLTFISLLVLGAVVLAACGGAAAPFFDFF